MGVALVTSNNRSARRSNNRNNNQETEFAGIWLNIGVMVGDEDKPEEQRFVRLPRGVAVDDLQTRKIYDTMDADFAGDVATSNNLIETLQELGAELEEGESKTLNLSVQIYRRVEAVEETSSKADRKSMREAILA